MLLISFINIAYSLHRKHRKCKSMFTTYISINVITNRGSTSWITINNYIILKFLWWVSVLLLSVANDVNVILEKRESVFTNDCDRYNCNLELMELRFEGHRLWQQMLMKIVLLNPVRSVTIVHYFIGNACNYKPRWSFTHTRAINEISQFLQSIDIVNKISKYIDTFSIKGKEVSRICIGHC